MRIAPHLNTVVRTGLLFLLLVAATTRGWSQQVLPFDPSRVCSYDGTPITGPIYEFAPSESTNQIIGNILQSIGLKPRFEIKAANVPNAAAMIYNNQRYILYSQSFVSMVNQTTRTDWAAVSILAHEIGHHLNGHTLQLEGNRLSHELEADEFSGFVLRRMGATMLEAQAAMRAFADEEATPTHPQKSARLEAIAVGWTKAGETTAKRPNLASQDEAEVKDVETPAPPSKRIMVDEDEVLGRVVFESAPEKEYYLLKDLNMIRINGDEKQVVGRIAKSDNEAYPYVILGKNKSTLFLAETGVLYSQSGQRMGYVTKP